jgi:hypothetical protein
MSLRSWAKRRILPAPPGSETIAYPYAVLSASSPFSRYEAGDVRAGDSWGEYGAPLRSQYLYSRAGCPCSFGATVYAEYNSALPGRHVRGSNRNVALNREGAVSIGYQPRMSLRSWAKRRILPAPPGSETIAYPYAVLSASSPFSRYEAGDVRAGDSWGEYGAPLRGQYLHSQAGCPCSFPCSASAQGQDARPPLGRRLCPRLPHRQDACAPFRAALLPRARMRVLLRGASPDLTRCHRYGNMRRSRVFAAYRVLGD